MNVVSTGSWSLFKALMTSLLVGQCIPLVIIMSMMDEAGCGRVGCVGEIKLAERLFVKYLNSLSPEGLE